MKNHEFSQISQLSELSNSVPTCSQLKVCKAPALAPFKTPSASPASTAAWRCDIVTISRISSPFPIEASSSSIHPSIAALLKGQEIVPCLATCLCFFSLLSALFKLLESITMIRVAMQSAWHVCPNPNVSKLKGTIRAIVYGLGLLSELVSLRKCH